MVAGMKPGKMIFHRCNQGEKVSPVIVNPGKFQVLKSKYRPLYKRVLRGISPWDAG